MLIPSIVRLTDSQIQFADHVISQVLHSVQHCWRVGKQIGTGWLRFDEQTLILDLNIKPVDRNFQLGGELCCAQEVGIVLPPPARRRCLDAFGQPDTLHGDGKNLVCTIGRSVTLFGEKVSNFIVGPAFFRQVEQACPHFATPSEFCDRRDPHFDIEFGNRPAASNDADQRALGRPVEHHLVHQAAQDRLAMRVCDIGIRPDLW